MVKSGPLILLFFAVLFFSVIVSEATTKSILGEQPHTLTSLQQIQVENTTSTSSSSSSSSTPNACSYTVAVKTSCSSTSFTRDQISLSFGDAYGGQVYAPRLDDPSTRTFERCSTDTFQITGPCMRGRICYLYLYRVGSDGWKPDSVKVYDRNNRAKFNYNTFIPYGVWFGLNLCNSAAAAGSMVSAA